MKFCVQMDVEVRKKYLNLALVATNHLPIQREKNKYDEICV